MIGFQIDPYTRTSSTLHHSKNEKRRPVALQCQPDISYTVYAHHQEIHDAPSNIVCQITQDRRRETGHNHVGGDGEVDPPNRYMKGLGQGIDGGEEDERGEWGERRSNGNQEEDQMFSPFGKYRVGLGRRGFAFIVGYGIARLFCGRK